MSEYIETEFNPCTSCGHKRCSSCLLFRLAKEKVEQSAADVVKVKHGRWKDRAYLNDYIWAECSNCGFIEENIKVVKLGCSSTDFVGIKWHYCPKCGTKMDGE